MRLTMEVALPATRAEVWEATSTVGGVNQEVGPLLRLTDPTDGARFDAEAWQDSTPVIWQLLFGVVPVDRHRIELVALPDGGGFRESSSSWFFRVWWHERALLDDPGGCVLRDSVEIEPKVKLADPMVGWAVRWTFRRRHRWLQRRFG